MKQLARGLLLGALIWGTSTAHAATTIETTGFSLAWTESSAHPLDMQLLSDTDGLVRIAMSVGALGERWDTNTHGDGGIGNAADHLLTAIVLQGYRITSMTLSAVVNGSMYLETRGCNMCETTPGTTANSSTLNWSILRGGEHAVLPTAYASQVDGTLAISSTAHMPLEGPFLLALGAENTVAASSSVQLVWDGWDWQQYTLQATAAVDLSDVVLSVQVTPVPEPSTYAMLLAGLGMVAWTARRRAA
ncbi:PEP-CTERM sorting domain-containing protein [Pseudoduganella chitinolytica]|uniref:PEP-CTERM sorting domain-containing protein n=1 Tax=Pseudoduganella chitinolytica TaxID=34070 RepID=A0ABY8BH92_9BURK|nr:PEP-CTERM sorting domain-containing protein [Pseudoduganella chitinolytica]WEF35215.1 PEP-CTERM sorting domain-containing protein [Pseudoduganella chitinolytica]